MFAIFDVGKVSEISAQIMRIKSRELKKVFQVQRVKNIEYPAYIDTNLFLIFKFCTTLRWRHGYRLIVCFHTAENHSPLHHGGASSSNGRSLITRKLALPRAKNGKEKCEECEYGVGSS